MDIEIFKLIALQETLRDMTKTATRFRDGAQVDGEDGLTERIDAAWIVLEWLDADLEAVAGDNDSDEPIDPQIERDRRDYEAGKAEAELRRAERSIYGREVADAFHAQDDLNAYNRGDE